MTIVQASDVTADASHASHQVYRQLRFTTTLVTDVVVIDTLGFDFVRAYLTAVTSGTLEFRFSSDSAGTAATRGGAFTDSGDQGPYRAGDATANGDAWMFFGSARYLAATNFVGTLNVELRKDCVFRK